MFPVEGEGLEELVFAPGNGARTSQEADPATLAELAAKSSKTGNPAYATRRD